jgi:3',5'-cyclic-AMP phosphodiesterase
MKMKSAFLASLALITGALLTPTQGTSAPQPELTFSVLSDIHLQSWDRSSTRRFSRALNDLKQAAPEAEALVLNGDLGNGFPEDYEALKKTLAGHEHPPIFYTIGNHEFYKAWHNNRRHWSAKSFPNGETEQASLDRFLQLTGESKVYYERQLKGYTFLFLGSERYRQSDPANEEDAYLSEDQLGWLRDRLINAAATAPDKPVFVFLHQPLQHTVSGSVERGVVQHEELRRLLTEMHPQAILFSGHTHHELSQSSTVVHKPFTMVNSSSVYEPFTAQNEPYPPEADRSEGLVVRVYPDHIQVQGRDFGAQAWMPSAHYIVPVQQKTGPSR